MYGFDLGFEFDSAKAVASFNPLSLSPSAWYDFSDLSTLFQDTAATSPVTADGQSVARVNDKSGNGRHLTQATAGFRPLYKTSGGLSWLESDGVDDVLKPATQFMTGSATASAVYASRNISVVAGAQSHFSRQCCYSSGLVRWNTECRERQHPIVRAVHYQPRADGRRDGEPRELHGGQVRHHAALARFNDSF
jgi:hypothetical protein